MIIANFLAIAAAQHLPNPADYELYHHASWRTAGHHWEFRVYWQKQETDDEEKWRINIVLRDGTIVKRFRNVGDRPTWEPWGDYLAAEVTPVKSPYETVVGIRGAGGLGSHWDTVFYGFTRSHMTFIGRAPALNANGPISYKGQRNRWVFDDCDFYPKSDRGPNISRHILFSISKGRTMKLLRSWPSKAPIRTVVQFKSLR